MQFKNFTKEKIIACFKNLDDYLSKFPKLWVKYLDLGFKIVRLIGLNDSFLFHIENQLNFCLKDYSTNYDDTLILWKENDFQNLANCICDDFNPKKNIRLRLETLYFKEKVLNNIQLLDNDFSYIKPIIDINIKKGIFIANDYKNHNYYYGVQNLDAEELIKEGHLFIQFFNNILKTKTSNLAHGAVIGLNNNGACICARGQRGKSTLSVFSLVKGFEYVADDYFIIYQNSNNELLASPIYSIITLSAYMYNKLYKFFNTFQYVSNNARKDKYVFNISNYHDKFKINYPIKFCIFPEIVVGDTPMICPCSQVEKNRALVQIIQSTLSQVGDLSESYTVKKMINMFKNLPFFKFNLCSDIEKNTEFLFNFMNNIDYSAMPIIGLDEICVDITFNIANILNSKTGIIYSMNKFATNLYENMLNGISIDKIILKLKNISGMPDNIENDVNLFVDILLKKRILTDVPMSSKMPKINIEFIKEDNFKLSLIEHLNEKDNELIRKK